MFARILMAGVFSLLLFPALSHPLTSKGIRFQRLSMEEGLSQTSVHCIFQDKKGLLWLGTENGLNRYSGTEFKAYKMDPQQRDSLSNNVVWRIVEDKEGNLWIATRGGGLNRFDHYTERFTRYQNEPGNPNSLSNNEIWALTIDRAGILWVGTHSGGLNRFDPKTGTFTRYFAEPDNPNALGNNFIRCAYEDSSGILWFGTNGGGLHSLEPGAEAFTRYTHQPENENSLTGNGITSILEDRSGKLWVGTKSGLNLWDREKNTITRFLSDPNEPRGLSDNGVRVISEDEGGGIWVGTDSGLNRYNPRDQTFIQYRADPEGLHSLHVDYIQAIYEDRSGVMWVGTRLGGLYRFQRWKKGFFHYLNEPENPNTLTNNLVWAILEDRRGAIWVGTDKGLDKIERDLGKVTHYSQQPPAPGSFAGTQVWSLCEDKNDDIWLGASNGLNKYDPETGSFSLFSLPSLSVNGELGKLVFTILEDRKGFLWLATIEGVKRFEPETKEFTVYSNQAGNPHTLSDNSVQALLQDREGTLWVGTSNGLNRFHSQSGTFTRYYADPRDPRKLDHDSIFYIHEDGGGNLWLATDGGGLTKWNREREIFTFYTRKDHLPSNVVNGILEDARGSLWLSTSNGLCRFDPHTETVKTFDSKDGLQSNEFNKGASFLGRRGEMFFGGVNGFNAFFPADIKDNPLAPPLVITGVEIFNQPVQVGEVKDGVTVLKQGSTETGSIQLSYKHVVFSIYYAALHYTIPEKNRYAYMMEKVDKQWNYVGNRHFATYAHLDPGRYVFRVKAANSDGVWNEEGIPLQITILPPFWMTWWFRGLFALGLLGGITLVIRYRLNRVRESARQEQLVLKREMEKQQLERELELKADFTAMLVHDLRNPLTASLAGIDLLELDYDTGDPPKIVSTLRNSTERMLRLVNDMLDISKFEAGHMNLIKTRISLPSLADSTIELMMPLCEKKGIHIQRDYQQLESLSLDWEKIGQVMGNFISNAVKFSPESSRIRVIVRELSLNGSGLHEFAVQDDGPGIPEEKQVHLFEKYIQLHKDRRVKGTGLGLAVSRLIVEHHGGAIGYRAGDGGKGSIFYFRLPVGDPG